MTDDALPTIEALVTDFYTNEGSPLIFEKAAKAINAQAEEIARLKEAWDIQHGVRMIEAARAGKAEAERDEWQGRCAWLASVIIDEFGGTRDERAWVDRAAAHWRDLTSANKALREQISIRLEDAERYRWLRMQHWNEAPVVVVANPKQAVKLGYDCPSLERLDAAIDAARKAKEAT